MKRRLRLDLVQRCRDRSLVDRAGRVVPKAARAAEMVAPGDARADPAPVPAAVKVVRADVGSEEAETEVLAAATVVPVGPRRSR